MTISRPLLIAGLIALTLAAAIGSILFGPVHLSLARMIAAFTGHGDRIATTILLELRLPRMLLGLGVGAMLGLAGAALQPVPEAFAQAASWRLELSGTSLQGLDDALLELDFVGDIGRLFAGTRLLDDWYFNGQRWQVGLKNIQALLKQPLSLSVLPLRADAPIYIDRAHRPDFADKKPQVAELRGASVKPVYRLAIAP